MVHRRKSLIKTLPQRLHINNRYQCVQREGVAVTNTAIELGSYQTQMVSYGEKEPKQNPTKPPQISLKEKNYLEFWLLRIIPLAKSELFQPFSAMIFQPQTHLTTLESSFTFSFSLQLWCTLCSHSRTNTTASLFFSFSVINPMHPQIGEAIRHVFKGMSQQALLRTWCSCLFK